MCWQCCNGDDDDRDANADNASDADNNDNADNDDNADKADNGDIGDNSDIDNDAPINNNDGARHHTDINAMHDQCHTRQCCENNTRARQRPHTHSN